MSSTPFNGFQPCRAAAGNMSVKVHGSEKDGTLYV
jgi:hypothetical protein